MSISKRERGVLNSSFFVLLDNSHLHFGHGCVGIGVDMESVSCVVKTAPCYSPFSILIFIGIPQCGQTSPLTSSADAKSCHMGTFSAVAIFSSVGYDGDTIIRDKLSLAIPNFSAREVIV